MYEIVLGRNESDRKKLGLDGTIFIGKHYVKMGAVRSLSNKVLLDVARTHVMLVAGKRGTGKCLDGDTEILMEDGNLIKIKDLENNSQKVLGLNEKLKITKLQKSDFFK